MMIIITFHQYNYNLGLSIKVDTINFMQTMFMVIMVLTILYQMTSF